MINQDQQLKEVLEKLKGADGKYIITDGMSDDIKQALTTINQENIDIFAPVYTDEELERIDNDEVDESDIEELDDDTDLSENSVSLEMTDDIVEDSTVDVSDLNDLF